MYNYNPFAAQPVYPVVTPPAVNQPQPQQPTSPITWVQGEAGAKAYLVGAGQSVVLWDSDAQTIYIKSADGSGLPSMRILDWTERVQAPKQAAGAPQTPTVEFVTRTEFEALRAEMDALRGKKAVKTDA